MSIETRDSEDIFKLYLEMEFFQWKQIFLKSQVRWWSKVQLVSHKGIALFLYSLYFCREEGNLYDVSLCRGRRASVQTDTSLHEDSLLYHSQSRGQWGLSMQGRLQYPVPFIRQRWASDIKDGRPIYSQQWRSPPTCFCSITRRKQRIFGWSHCFSKKFYNLGVEILKSLMPILYGIQATEEGPQMYSPAVVHHLKASPPFVC